MSHPKDLRIEDYTYQLPDERIAKYPLATRDASKLLIYKNGEITEDTYRNIAAHIPADTLMVFNQTKVVHARLLFTKASGSVIEVFCLAPHDRYTDIQTAMLQKGKVEWECLVGGASKWKDGVVLQLANQAPHFMLSAKIINRMQVKYHYHPTCTAMQMPMMKSDTKQYLQSRREVLLRRLRGCILRKKCCKASLKKT